MIDRGTEIVTLAKNILARNKCSLSLPQCTTKELKLSKAFRELCIASLLSVHKGSSLKRKLSSKSINRYRKTELNALIYYVALKRNFSEKDLFKELTCLFPKWKREKTNLAELDEIKAYLILKLRQ